MISGENRFTLAVVGQFKRGKSSLMNAIIGRELLPTGGHAPDLGHNGTPNGPVETLHRPGAMGTSFLKSDK